MTPSTVRPPLAQSKPEVPRPFAKIPHDIAADPRLEAIDVRLLTALLFFARDKDHCWPSDNTLGERIHRSRPTVQRRLRHLEFLGLIGRETLEKTTSNPTGRLLRLKWRSRETPPVSRTTPEVHSPVSYELEKQSEKLCAAPQGGEKPKTIPPVERPPMTHDEIIARYTECGWLDRPKNDPLRQIAERHIANALRNTPEPTPTARTFHSPTASHGRDPGRLHFAKLFPS